MLDWFRTIPLWLDLDGLRVVHACWSDADIAHLRRLVSPTGGVTDQIVIDGTDPERKHRHLRRDRDGPQGPGSRPRRAGVPRQGWARAPAGPAPVVGPTATTLRSAALIPDGTPAPTARRSRTYPTNQLEGVSHVYTGDVPVIVGHYWETGAPKVLDPKVACVDYSAGKGGPLVAYRWYGEANLVDAHFVSSPRTRPLHAPSERRPRWHCSTTPASACPPTGPTSLRCRG